MQQMGNGVIPWLKPWIANGKAYSLLNQMRLGRPGEYVAFKQCQEAGRRIKQGEKARIPCSPPQLGGLTGLMRLRIISRPS